MNSSPRQAGSSPQVESRNRTSTPSAPSIVSNVSSDWLGDLIGIGQGPEFFQSHRDPQDQLHGFANDAGQYQQWHANDINSYTPQACDASPPFAARNGHELLRGMADYAAQSSPGTQNVQVVAGERVFSCDGSSSYDLPPPSMQSTPPFPMEHIAPPGQPTFARQTKYEPFQHRFHTADEAREHRRRATRFDRTPYLEPETDLTIADIEQNRPYHVMRIYNAMTSGESAKDNRGSIAMKRWVLDAHYLPDLVEAYAHKLFDCLLLQAKEGFRGWVHNDYVVDERKGDDIDKDVDCAGRLNNIILALEQEKTICEDVMNSACQIRMFVNAPRAYANRKHQNRVGNSKRGRTKDTSDANPRSAKAQKTGGRRTRARSTTAVSDLPCCRGTTPQQQEQQLPRPMAPYYKSPSQQQSSPKPSASNYPAPQSIRLHRPTHSAPIHSFGLRSAVAMSPPTSSPRTPLAPQLHTPRMATAPPQHQSFYPPSPLYNSTYLVPASPNDAKPTATNLPSENWHEGGFGNDPYLYNTRGGQAIDPVLSSWDSFPSLAPFEAERDTNRQSGEFVNLSEIERLHTEHVANGDDGPSGGYWDTCLGSELQDFGSH